MRATKKREAVAAGRHERYRVRAAASPSTRRGRHPVELLGRGRAAEIGRRGCERAPRRRPPRALPPRRAGRAACSSRSAVERSIAAGLAIPRPAMSGAEPCTGSKSPGPESARLAEGASPSPPVTAAARSERMSPNMFSVTITSNCSGFRRELHRGVVDQHVLERHVRVGRLPARARPAATCATSRARSPCRPTSACRRRDRASSKPRRAIRSTCDGWYSHVSKTVPSSRTPRAP